MIACGVHPVRGKSPSYTGERKVAVTCDAIEPRYGFLCKAKLRDVGVNAWMLSV